MLRLFGETSANDACSYVAPQPAASSSSGRRTTEPSPNGSATESGRYVNTRSGATSVSSTRSSARCRSATIASSAATPPPAMTTRCLSGDAVRCIVLSPGQERGHALQYDVHRPPWNARMERQTGVEAEGQVEAQELLPEAPRRRDADPVRAIRIRANGDRPVRIAGHLERHLREGRLVEFLHHTHADWIESESRLGLGRFRGDVLSDRVCLQKGEERLLHRKVAGVPRSIDALLPCDAPRREVGGQEAAIVRRQLGIANRRHVRRERDEEVVALAGSVLEVGRPCFNRRKPRPGAALDAPPSELLEHDLVQLRPERLDVASLERREDEANAVSHLLAAEPGLDHEDHLVERPRALVEGRHVKEDGEFLAAARPIAEVAEPLAEREHLRRRPDRLSVLGEPRDLLRPHGRPRREHEEVVVELPAVDPHAPPIRIDLVERTAHELDSASLRRAAERASSEVGSAPNGM